MEGEKETRKKTSDFVITKGKGEEVVSQMETEKDGKLHTPGKVRLS